MDLFYRLICFITKIIGYLWLRVEICLIGQETIPGKGPLIIAPNHASYLDPPLIGSTWLPYRLDFFASHHLYKSSFLKMLLNNLRTHPIVRENGLQALRQALKFLSQGKTIVLFPEGTRSRSGTMNTLKKGIAMLSAKGKSPVVPVFIDGTYDVWPPGKKYPRFFHRHRVRIFIGKPLPCCGEGEEEYSEWLSSLKEAYMQLEKAAKEKT